MTDDDARRRAATARFHERAAAAYARYGDTQNAERAAKCATRAIQAAIRASHNPEGCPESDETHEAVVARDDAEPLL